MWRIIFLLIVLPLGCRLGVAAEAGLRLVSLAPSITEMVFDIDAGDMLVGVTDHCRYPPGAEKIPKIGMYQTPNLEAITVLQPDLVLVLEEHRPVLSTLADLGIRHKMFDHRSFAGLLESLTRLGALCSREEKAAEQRRILEQAFAPPAKTADSPSMLFFIGRHYGAGTIADAYAVGRDNLYDLLITAVGCTNAYGGKLAYPVLSAEGVAALAPDIVIEALGGQGMGTNLLHDDLRRDWESLSGLPAVRGDRICFLDADYVFVPGMRLVRLKRDLEDIVQSLAVPEPAGAP